MYCVRENRLPPAYHSHYLSFFFLSKQNFWRRFLSPYGSQSLQILHALRESPSILWERKPRWISFAFFFHFSISHSHVIHRKICVKDTSGTTLPRILKFGTNVGYDVLYCVRENQLPPVYHFLYLSIFLSLQSNFL